MTVRRDGDVFRFIFPEPNTGCWLWGGPLDEKGYGRVAWKLMNPVRGKATRVHRFMYESVCGKIPADLQIDHLCRTPACVNPDHLEAVTSRENTLRGNTVPARNLRKTHCAHGHPYTPENTMFTKKGDRDCRACDILRARKRNAKLGMSAVPGQRTRGDAFLLSIGVVLEEPYFGEGDE